MSSVCEQLALIQTRTIIEELKKRNADLKFETITMNTMGDKILDSALSKIGEKSLFTRELEDALLKKKVDFVVHSLKDLPTEIPPGLVVGCVFRRDNPNDAVVMHPKHAHKKLSDLPPGSIIGTSALRRAAQLQRKYPQFKIENIRGNLNTRFRKLSEENSCYAAIILAVSGLERMNWNHLISEILTPEDCMYAVCQGALGIECRADDEATLKLLADINDLDTALCCVAERSFLRKLEGGCSVPVSVFTEKTEDKLLLRGGVFSISGDQAVKQEITFDLNEKVETEKSDKKGEPEAFISIVCHQAQNLNRYHRAQQLGRELASAMVNAGAGEILQAAKHTTKEEILAEHAKRKQKLADEAEAGTNAELPAKMPRVDKAMEKIGSSSSSDLELGAS
ncbi:hypothetical protein C0Q70_12070 [Pomacea canaliculata]|uniref:hydroxymethylbilane synthase n=1 Tax=Pomacea canaliculata TaxID=400727 RepID=A0A2T7P0H6_POMCA|nr:hypothetical protein C0Q70_12070 [Pomacea canaliculata]